MPFPAKLSPGACQWASARARADLRFTWNSNVLPNLPQGWDTPLAPEALPVPSSS